MNSFSDTRTFSLIRRSTYWRSMKKALEEGGSSTIELWLMMMVRYVFGIKRPVFISFHFTSFHFTSLHFIPLQNADERNRRINGVYEDPEYETMMFLDEEVTHTCIHTYAHAYLYMHTHYKNTCNIHKYHNYIKTNDFVCLI